MAQKTDAQLKEFINNARTGTPPVWTGPELEEILTDLVDSKVPTEEVDPLPQITALWGWADTNSVSSPLITNAQGNGHFDSGATIVADYTANNAPKWLYMLEPTTEPLKTRWVSGVSQGNISMINDSEVFRYRGTVSNGGTTYNVYMSTFETEQTQTPIEFRVS